MSFAPLAGVRVVDVTTSIAGPYCAQILAALGADVVKVERPDSGDDARAWGPPFWAGESPMFLSANAGKRSLAVSLREPRGRDVVLRLAERGDVFLQSLRPGLAERLGLGAAELRRRNPRLVTCAIGSYGRTGPRRAEPGYDALMQAAGGLISVTGEPGRPGVRVGASVIDQGTGAWAAIGILAALLERGRTGQGRDVDVSLYETAVGYLGYHLAGYLADGTVPRGAGTRFPMVAPYQVLRARDGGLMVAAGNDRLFALLARELGLAELVGDARFATNAGRVAHREELVALLEARLAEADVDEWHERLTRAGVPAAPVADVAGVAQAEQTEALGLLQALEHPVVSALRLVALPLTVDGDRPAYPSPPPLLGQHTEEVLRDLGYADDEVRDLAERKIVKMQA
ncbi:MAG TPA: CoA transferase [Gaiellaceae bacterium]|jgi:crotonobetainyl-CoA:carnitine CoA-transferase CaiB-like acyl-CoA transferase|nr:CoA transferase [Gaiellaceae bacterium]